MVDDAALQRMALTAYESAMDGSRWHALIDDVMAGVHATGAVLFAPHSGDPSTIFGPSPDCDAAARLAMTRLPPSPWERYTARLAAPLRAGECLFGHTVVQPRDVAEYHERVDPRFRYDGMLCLVVEGDEALHGVPRTHLMACRYPGRPVFDDHDLSVLKALHAPLRRALHVYWGFEHLRRLERGPQDAYDALPNPVLVLHGDGTIAHANPSAEVLLRRGTMLRAEWGRLVKAGQYQAQEVSVLARSAAAGVAQSVGLWVNGREPFETATLQLTKVPPGSAMDDRWPGARVVATLHVDGRPEHASRLDALARRHGFTRTEREILLQLAEGATPREAAERNGVRVSTVRTHIRHLLEKSGSRRMVDLIRTLGPAADRAPSH
jgi:DNA-binding CsgD family transcriptional regulator/PAS domain-containing protein